MSNDIVMQCNINHLKSVLSLIFMLQGTFKGLAIVKHDKPFVINKLTERRKIKQNTRLLFGQL